MIDSEKLSHELQDIKQMMEHSSRFISLSGLSGISAGVCALTGAWFAESVIQQKRYLVTELKQTSLHINTVMQGNALQNQLLLIGIITFIAAFSTAFFFTYRRSKKSNIPIWGTTARRLMINVCIPMCVGGIFLYAMMQNGIYDFVASGCLIFYGLGVVNASKYTLKETRYLGYAEILLGLFSAYFIGEGIYFWAAGFGITHIIYGIFMWMKYERNQQA